MLIWLLLRSLPENIISLAGWDGTDEPPLSRRFLPQIFDDDIGTQTEPHCDEAVVGIQLFDLLHHQVVLVRVTWSEIICSRNFMHSRLIMYFWVIKNDKCNLLIERMYWKLVQKFLLVSRWLNVCHVECKKIIFIVALILLYFHLFSIVITLFALFIYLFVIIIIIIIIIIISSISIITVVIYHYCCYYYSKINLNSVFRKRMLMSL